ncbi:MAG: molecular chaperone SurA [Halomonadaceae bacterium]|nr:MAG: molecular chaperone SurA [Halomonadaceae bacterium]
MAFLTGHKTNRALTLITALLLALGVAANAQANRQPLDRVIAVVEDDVILQSELESRVRTIQSRLNAQGTQMPPAGVLEQRVLEQLVLDSVQLQMAERVGMRVSDTELNDTMRNIAQRNEMTLQQFERALASEGLTFQQAREQIRQEMLVSRVQQQQVGQRIRVTDREVDNYLRSAEGQDRSGVEHLLGHILVSVSNFNNRDEVAAAQAKAESLRQQILEGEDFRQVAVAESDGRNALEGGELGWRRSEQLPSLAANVIPQLSVGQPSEVLQSGSGFHIVTPLDRRGGAAREVEQNRVRHILLAADPAGDNEAVEARIRELKEQLEADGAAFGALARELSDDPGSGADGGRLGWVNPGEMVPEFEEAVQGAAVGEITGPVRTQFGWHLLRVEERRTRDIGQDIQRNEARQTLQQRQFELELENWLNEIRAEAYVEVKAVVGGMMSTGR